MKLCNFDFSDVKITTNSMLFQLHYCNNYNKNYVVLTSDFLKYNLQYVISSMYIAVIITTKIMYF